MHWDRDAMYATGALNLGELLALVPGVTSIATGFILSPQAVAWYGNPGRLRIFVDGVEYDAIGLRNGGIHDLASFPLWSLEDVTVERSAGELRVHLRTWRVDRTTPATRTDILTGSENLNLYRGFFGRRFANGMAFQVAGSQHSSVSRGGMDGDALGGMARLGWANRDWSIDGTWLRQGVNRNEGARYITTEPVLHAMPRLKGSEGAAYLRAAWRDPQADGPWAQLIASSQSAAITHRVDQGTTSAVATPPAAAADTVDSTATRTQYVLAAGITRWGLRLSSTNRLRVFQGKSFFAPGARVEYDSRLLTISGFAERGVDSTTRTDVLARFAPFSWLNLGGSVSRAAPANASLGAPTTSSRLELAVKIRDRWLSGGMIARGASPAGPPIEFDTTLRTVSDAEATGAIVSLHGTLLLGWTLDADVVQWQAAGPYRPQTQARTRLGFESSFLQRFPRGNFHLAVSGTHEFRSATYTPLGASPVGQKIAGYSALSTLLEIRISSAVVSWQYRNLLGAIYATYPGYVMPRLVNVYGVRWEFWN